MNAKEFFDKVVEMRKAQKDYFKTRDVLVLKNAKALEREIDEEIKRVFGPIDKQNDEQLKLF